MNQPDLTAEMRALVDQFGIIDFVTNKLVGMQQDKPEINKLVLLTPYEISEELGRTLPSEGKRLLGTAPWNYNFYSELGKVQGVFVLSSSRYPALFERLKSHTQCVVTMEFLHHSFPIIEGNANAVNELNEVLKTKKETPWFPTVPVPKPDNEAWKQAIMESLLTLIEKNPRKFPEIVKANMHNLGFDNAGIKNKDVMAVVNEFLSQ
jgi:hypothetical protein